LHHYKAFPRVRASSGLPAVQPFFNKRKIVRLGVE